MMYKKPIIFFDTPDLSFIDVQARKLIYAYSEARRWEDHPVKLYVYRIQIDRKEGKIYFPHPIVKAGDSMCKIKDIRLVMRARQEVWEKYHEREIKYKEKLRKKHMAAIDRFEQELTGEKLTTYDVINKIQKDPIKYTNKKGNIDWHLIRLEEKIPENEAKSIQKFLEKKRD